MKKFLFRVLLPTVVILSVLFFGGEFYLRSLPNDFKTKNQYLEKNARDLKIMVLGASTLSMGVKPCFFDLQPAYNFAYASQNLEYNYWILRKCFDRMDSLRFVFLDMSWGASWNSGDQISPRINKFYRLYYECPDAPFEFEMMSSIKELYYRIRPRNGKDAYQSIDEDGYQSKYYDDVPYDGETWKRSVEWSVNYNDELMHNELAASRYRNGVENMCNIIRKCQERNVKVILLTPPAMGMFYEQMDKDQLRIMYHVADSLTNAFDNVIYWDFMRADSLFTVDEFYNPTHLNPRGAMKLTLMLNDSINNLK